MPTSQAWADPATEREVVTLDEVIVTANRREESIAKVPASIVAITQEEIDARGINTVDDVARLTPGVTFGQTGDGLTKRIAIRGISSTVGAATTGIYIDDTPIQVRGGTGVVTENVYPIVFDQQRIEILRGPQGTLYGAGAQGGAIRFLTPEPSLTEASLYSRADLSFTDGGDPTYEAGIAGGAPIVDDKLGLRASVLYRNEGGFIDSTDYTGATTRRKDKNSQDAVVVRTALKYAPTDSLTITPSVHYQKQGTDGTPYFWVGLSNPGNGELRSGWPQNETSSDTFWLPSLKVQWSFDSVDFVSNTSFFNRSLERNSDYSAFLWALLVGSPSRPLPQGGYESLSTADVRQNSFTQELRLVSKTEGRLSWVAGAFYEKARLYTNQYVEDPDLPNLTAAEYGLTVAQAFGQGLDSGLYSFVVDQHAMDEQLAAYGQVDYALTSRVKATAGARVARSKFEFSRAGNGPLNCVHCSSSGKLDETPVTPKVGLSFQYDDQTLFYASAAKGYRIGGVNNPTTTPTATCAANLAVLGLTSVPSTYDSDSLWSYEVGAKNGFADGKVQLHTSVYYIDWSNIQQAVSLGGCGSSFKANLGDARSQGVDLAAEIRPYSGLTLTLAAGYTDAKYKGDVYAGLNTTTTPPTRRILVEDGDSLGVTPWSTTVSAEYAFQLASRSAFIRADYSYNARNNDDTPVRDSRTVSYDADVQADQATRLLSARLGVRLNGVDVSLYGENLLNDAPLLGRYHDAKGWPLYYATTLRPRTIGFTGVYRF
ncbi:MAG: TonB-dependent receptor [Gammaproteobacteria bacterium]